MILREAVVRFTRRAADLVLPAPRVITDLFVRTPAVDARTRGGWWHTTEAHPHSAAASSGPGVWTLVLLLAVAVAVEVTVHVCLLPAPVLLSLLVRACVRESVSRGRHL